MKLTNLPNYLMQRPLILTIGATVLLAAAGIWLFANHHSYPERHAPKESAYTIDHQSPYYKNLLAAARTARQPAASAVQNLLQAPVATWLTSVRDIAEVRRVQTEAQESGTTALYVLYYLPDRDMSGNHSAGGAANRQIYLEWVREITKAIGKGRAVIIIEPDALADIPSLPANKQAERIDLLGTAVKQLAELPNTAAYLDAGNAHWRDANTTATLIKKVNQASGGAVTSISLNVSQYIATETTKQFATEVQNVYGNNLYTLIDTSRNGGAVAAGEWCNPDGQKLGNSNARFDPRQTVQTAYIKRPGESDGSCGLSQKPAGEFDIKLLENQLL